MKTSNNRLHCRSRKAYALVMVLVAAVLLAILGSGLLNICYGVRVRAAKLKRETVAMLAAEAGYEQGIFWMSQQDDVLTGLADGTSGSSGYISFTDSRCEYEVQFHDFIGSRPIFRILSTGHSGSASRAVDVYVMQKITGWDMGLCRIPSGASSTTEVYFANNEIINMPIHINDRKDSPDTRDIYISGSPQFNEKVEMGESRYRGASDKYNGVMGLFDGGILFDQPDVKITNEAAVQSKVNRFRDSTLAAFRFTPAGTANVQYLYNAVQLEFFVESGVGKVRITNNCTVRGDNRDWGNDERDWRIVSTSPLLFGKYDIYAYHYKPVSEASITYPVADTYVTQTFAGIASEPGGQIYVNGNVVIGSADYDQMVVGGKLTIVATGNIWIADPIVVAGTHDASGVPDKDTNPNVLGLISQGVIKVIDPGTSDDFGTLSPVEDRNVGAARMHSYVPVANGANTTTNIRTLPDPMKIEAAVTVGGGGWGAENVGRRKEFSGNSDDLILIGSICEVVRGVVGQFNQNTGLPVDGYTKHYTIDERLLEGVLPGNIWFGGKFVPAPAGWHDYRVDD